MARTSEATTFPYSIFHHKRASAGRAKHFSHARRSSPYIEQELSGASVTALHPPKHLSSTSRAHRKLVKMWRRFAIFPLKHHHHGGIVQAARHHTCDGDETGGHHGCGESSSCAEHCFFIAEGPDTFSPAGCDYRVGAPLDESTGSLEPLQPYWEILQGSATGEEYDDDDDDDALGLGASWASLSSGWDSIDNPHSSSSTPLLGSPVASVHDRAPGKEAVVGAAACAASARTMQRDDGDDNDGNDECRSGRRRRTRADPYEALLKERYWIEARVALLAQLTARLRALYTREQCSRMRSNYSYSAAATAAAAGGSRAAYCDSGNLNVWRRDNSGTGLGAGAHEACALQTVRFWQRQLCLCRAFESLAAVTIALYRRLHVFGAVPYGTVRMPACSSWAQRAARDAFLAAPVAVVTAQAGHTGAMARQLRDCLRAHQHLREEMRQFEMLERRAPAEVIERSGMDMKSFLSSIALPPQDPPLPRLEAGDALMAAGRRAAPLGSHEAVVSSRPQDGPAGTPGAGRMKCVVSASEVYLGEEVDTQPDMQRRVTFLLEPAPHGTNSASQRAATQCSDDEREADAVAVEDVLLRPGDGEARLRDALVELDHAEWQLRSQLASAQAEARHTERSAPDHHFTTPTLEEEGRSRKHSRRKGERHRAGLPEKEKLGCAGVCSIM